MQISPKVLAQFSKELQNREKARKARMVKEDKYNGKVTKFVDKKFEKLK